MQNGLKFWHGVKKSLEKRVYPEEPTPAEIYEIESWLPPRDVFDRLLKQASEYPFQAVNLRQLALYFGVHPNTVTQIYKMIEQSIAAAGVHIYIPLRDNDIRWKGLVDGAVLRELRRGHTVKIIAQHLALPTSTVVMSCERLTEEGIYNRKEEQAKLDEQIAALRKQGMGAAAIRAVLGTERGRVQAAVLRGGPELRMRAQRLSGQQVIALEQRIEAYAETDQPRSAMARYLLEQDGVEDITDDMLEVQERRINQALVRIYRRRPELNRHRSHRPDNE